MSGPDRGGPATAGRCDVGARLREVAVGRPGIRHGCHEAVDDLRDDIEDRDGENARGLVDDAEAVRGDREDDRIDQPHDRQDGRVAAVGRPDVLALGGVGFHLRAPDRVVDAEERRARHGEPSPLCPDLLGCAEREGGDDHQRVREHGPDDGAVALRHVAHGGQAQREQQQGRRERPVDVARVVEDARGRSRAGGDGLGRRQDDQPLPRRHGEVGAGGDDRHDAVQHRMQPFALRAPLAGGQDQQATGQHDDRGHP